MHLYNTLIKKNSEEKIEDIILLKEGFSLGAFCFGPLWFLIHKMWKEFFFLIVLSVVSTAFANSFLGFNKILLEIAFAFIIAINANYWLGKHLQKKNYQFVGLIFGDNKSKAQLRLAQNFAADELNEFSDAILNPKLHRQMTKSKKQNAANKA